ncbi:MAG: hypothetical protein E7173_02125 [Firmicutes bacterium]|nr:hypothetical protein [Bacillota bacterium]
MEMKKLNEILHELGISKVKLAKFLGVSRQMIYNYLELDSINKWPKDKKVLLLNLLGIKAPNELETIKIDTDYIIGVETRLNNLVENKNQPAETISIFEGLGQNQKELLSNIIDVIKEKLDDDKDIEAFYSMKYLYNFLQSIDTSRELKYMLAYVAKAAGFEKPNEFVFNEDEQFVFESILFSAMTLYNGGGASKSRLAESHRRFEAQIEHKMEERISRTLELNTLKVQALKELNYSVINEENAAEVLEKIAEIQSRKVGN